MIVWLALACGPTDPRAPVEDALARPLEDGERAQLPERGLALVLRPDRLTVVGFGWPEENRIEPVDIELTHGDLVRHERLGKLVKPLFDILLAWAETWKDLGYRDPEFEFDGSLWLFVDRRTRDSTLVRVLFTAGQAQFGDQHLVGIGPRLGGGPPNPAPVVQVKADETRRPSALHPLRIGQVHGDDAYVIDDRAGRIRVDTLKKAPLVVTTQDSPMAMLRENPGDPVLYPSYASAAASAQHPILPSLEMLLHVSKQLDDEMMAELQRVREPVKRTWLDAAIAVARDAPEATAWLNVARDLGTGTPNPAAQEFLDDPVQSRPVGFYGESEDLGRIFRRDRWLSSSLQTRSPALRSQLTAVLKDPAVAPLIAAERVHRAVWTNPAAKPTLEDGGHFVLAPLRSNESAWVDSQGGTAGIPDVMEAWVSAIEAGEASIDLHPDSGFYDHQQWALEPLLTHPDGYDVGPGYRERLRDAFKAGVALRRETQVKDLMLPSIGSAASVLNANIAPELRVEPVPTHYRRSAEVYGWLLENALSRGELSTEWSERAAEMRSLYGGMAALSSVDLGLSPGEPLQAVMEGDRRDVPAPSAGLLGKLGGLGGLDGLDGPTAPEAPPPEPSPKPVPVVEVPVEGPEVERAEDWLAGWQGNPALGEDVRMMVPAGQREDGSTIGWAVLGVRPVDLVVTYEEPPTVTPLKPAEVDLHLLDAHYTVLVPYFTEVTASEPLDRAAFRALADQYPIASELIAALAR